LGSSFTTIESKKNKCPLRFIIFFILLSLAFIILLFLYDYDNVLFTPVKNFMFNVNTNEKTHVSQTNTNTEWSFDISAFGTESCIRLYDVDGDGFDDILFGAAGLKFVY
jgi:hypothetical protein